MTAYPEDLQRRVIASVDRGMPGAEVAHVFAVSIATIKGCLLHSLGGPVAECPDGVGAWIQGGRDG